jgi:hypothetical protein
MRNVLEMVRRFLRQRFGSRGLVVALVVLALLGSMSAGGPGSGLEMAPWAILVLAAGSVSRDVSSGALQMILSRPIRRGEYLFGRYLGILASYAIFLAATSVLILALRVVGVAVRADRIPVAAGEAFLTGAFQAAILLFFSTFLPGIADLLGLLLLYVVTHLPPGRLPWLADLSRGARENMLPTVPWQEVLAGHGILEAATGRWVFALTVYLALAAIVFSRRELPYGQD